MTRKETGAVRPGPPVCGPVWSSREPIVGVDLAGFQQAGEEVAEAFAPDQGVLGRVSSTGVVVTIEGAPLDALEAEHLVAVVDVDPVKQVMLLSGPGEPASWAAVLFLVLRYREERAAVLGLQTDTVSKPMDRWEPGETDDRRDPEPPFSGEGLGGASAQGWGFEEPTAAGSATGAVPSSGSLLLWTRWALQGLRERPVTILPHGNGLAVDDDLIAAAKRLKAYSSSKSMS